MSTAEKPAKILRQLHLDIDQIERMSPEERLQLDLPDHTQLPDHDETIVENFQEHPQGTLLTDSLDAVIKRLHPDGHYLIGHDNGIYWAVDESPLRGVKSPDWFYVPGVPPSPAGTFRGSYVLWKEHVRPLIVLEFVSGNGSEERDQTPSSGKFWVYENMIRPTYYGIFEVDPDRIEIYRLVQGRFEPLPANEGGRFPIEELGVELGIWNGLYRNYDATWMRWWDTEGNLLPTSQELTERLTDRLKYEAIRTENEAARAHRESERAERLAAQLRALGIEPEA